MRKNEFYINSKNIKHVIKNDMLIFRANCIKLRSMIRENVKSVKNIKIIFIALKKTVVVSKKSLLIILIKE